MLHKTRDIIRQKKKASGFFLFCFHLNCFNFLPSVTLTFDLWSDPLSVCQQETRAHRVPALTFTEENFLCLPLDHAAQGRSLDSTADKSFENGNTAQLLGDRAVQTALRPIPSAPRISLWYFYREKYNVWCQ